MVRGVSIALLVLLGSVSFGLPARASDAELSRALAATGCIADRVDVKRKEPRLQIYEITCVGNPPRVVGIVCANNKCSASSRGDNSNNTSDLKP
jgi:hypothetical protein